MLLENMDSLFRCCLEVLEEREYPTSAFSVGYDSDEEMLDQFLLEKRETMLKSEVVQVRRRLALCRMTGLY